MATVLAIVSLLAAGDAEPESITATVYVTRGAVSAALVVGVRTQMDEALLAAGMKTKNVGTAQGKRGKEMLACFGREECLERLADKVGATHLVLVSLVEQDGMYSAEVLTWTAGLETRKTQIGASTADEVGFSVARTAGWALGRLESQQRALARAEVPPPPNAEPGSDDAKSATKTTGESRDAPPEMVASTESIAGELPRQRDGQVTLDQLMAEGAQIDGNEDAETPRLEYREEAPSQSFAVQVLAAGGLLPVQHNRTFLAVGDTVMRNRLGVPSAALGVALRLPWRPVPDLYQTTMVSYGFDTLLLLSFDAGLEKRWPLLRGRIAPLVGATVNLAFLGLPVPAGNGEKLASAWALGFFGYAGGALWLHGRVALHLHVGYRHALRRVTQFSAGGDTYYARDAHGDTWELYLGGLMARLGVSFEF